MLKDKFENIYDKAITLGMEYIPKLILAIVVLIIGWWLIKRIGRLMEKGFVKKDTDPGLRTFLKTTISVALKAVLIISVMGMIGIQTTSFVAVLGAAGLAIGLALQGSLSNFAGGALILAFKPFRVGDVIENGNYNGEVKEIQIFNTILLTPEHKTVIIPNGQLANGVIVNYTATGDIRAQIELKISSAHSIEKVRSIIIAIIEADERIHKDPEPQVLVSGFGNDALSFIVRFFTKVDERVKIESETWEKIKLEFIKQGIEDSKNYSFVKNV